MSGLAFQIFETELKCQPASYKIPPAAYLAVPTNKKPPCGNSGTFGIWYD
jgi:hypothetical protein